MRKMKRMLAGISATLVFLSTVGAATACQSCNHVYSDWNEGLPATCMSIGYDVRTCKECGMEEKRINAALGHTYSDWENLIANETKTVYVKECSNCGDTQIKSVPHVYVDGVCTDCGCLQTVGLKFEKIEGGYKVSAGSCNDLEIYIPKEYNGEPVIAIAERGFFGCSKLEAISIPNTVKEIGAFAFNSCALKSIKIPEGVTIIEEYTFGACNALTSVELPESLLEIGRYAFISCTSLGSITIPKAVRQIGEGAFCYCSNLTSVILENVSGWHADETLISESSLADAASAALCFRSTHTVCDWTRMEI